MVEDLNVLGKLAEGDSQMKAQLDAIIEARNIQVPLFNKAIELGMADSRDAGQFLIDELRTPLGNTINATAALITSQGEHAIKWRMKPTGLIQRPMASYYSGFDYRRVRILLAYFLIRGSHRLCQQNRRRAFSRRRPDRFSIRAVAKFKSVVAEGATEQASSLEETSSSLEELSNMTKQNADNAKQANMLAFGANTAADKGAAAMSGMARAMQEIKKSSDETAKIIKVIDEIAFQTNLLALNAAVEAARAGEGR